ncbi:MAG: response regulator transcription factor [Ilumatobacteraceae bacterium]
MADDSTTARAGSDHDGRGPGARLRIFLVDDHEVVRRGVRDMLETEDDFEVVGEAADVQEALSRVAAVRPDVAVLDVRLPDGSGVELCRELRSTYPDLACLMLTSFDDDEALFEAIVAGASGYVLKQVKGLDIVAAVRHVGAGGSLLDPALTARVMTRLRTAAVEDPRLAGLSAQERRVLDLLAEGLTNRQIAREMYLAEKTVKNYVSNLLTKMGMSRRTEAAVYAARHARPLSSTGDHGATRRP